MLEQKEIEETREITADIGEVNQDYENYCEIEKEDYETNSLKDYIEVKEITPKLFNEPKIISVVGNSNSGKSNLVYSFIKELKSNYKCKIYSYGLRFNLKENKINSINELEKIKNSIIFLDEFSSILDVEDRRKKKLIEKTFRLIFHHNNILVLVGNPENYKKFISSKSNVIIYFNSDLDEFINGSRIKNICLNYKGYELGYSVLELNKNECIVYDREYKKVKVSYLKEYDSKSKNCSIICSKKKCPK